MSKAAKGAGKAAAAPETVVSTAPVAPELLPASPLPPFSLADIRNEKFDDHFEEEPPPLPLCVQRCVTTWARPGNIFSNLPYEASFVVRSYDAFEDESALDALERRRDLALESFDPQLLSDSLVSLGRDAFGPWRWVVATFLHISHHLSVAATPASELLRRRPGTTDEPSSPSPPPPPPPAPAPKAGARASQQPQPPAAVSPASAMRPAAGLRGPVASFFYGSFAHSLTFVRASTMPHAHSATLLTQVH